MDFEQESYFKKIIPRLNFNSFTCHIDLVKNDHYTFIMNVWDNSLITFAYWIKILL